MNNNNQSIRKALTARYTEDTNKGVSASMKIQNEKIKQIRTKVQDKEAEIERLSLQIAELTRKIDEQGDMAKDPKGTNLSLRILEIHLQDQSHSSIMYTISTDTLDQYFSSSDSRAMSPNHHIFDLESLETSKKAEVKKFKIDKFQDIFNIKVYGSENGQQTLILETQLSMDQLPNIFS